MIKVTCDLCGGHLHDDRHDRIDFVLGGITVHSIDLCEACQAAGFTNASAAHRHEYEGLPYRVQEMVTLANITLGALELLLTTEIRVPAGTVDPDALASPTGIHIGDPPPTTRHRVTVCSMCSGTRKLLAPDGPHVRIMDGRGCHLVPCPQCSPEQPEPEAAEAKQ